MHKGFSVPLTPGGKSALATLPPWHYSSDCIAVEYWADPAAIAALLPPGVAPDEKSGGRAFFWFLDWQFTASDDELTDPARYQYREAFALVEAIFDGTPINYCPFIFVDNDAAIARGWAQGFPKKLGSVFQTRSFSAPSAAAAPLAKGSRFGGSLAAHGERLVTARIQLEEKVENPAAIFNRPTVMRRYFPQLSAGLQKKPAVDELTMSLTDELAVVDVWAGSAELKIPEVQGEDLHSLEPKRIGRGYRLGMSYSVTDLRILKNYVR
jgi:acetoacetate decarboxylase